MKCHILHDFRTSTPYKVKSSYRFKELHKREASETMTSCLGGVKSSVFNV